MREFGVTCWAGRKVIVVRFEKRSLSVFGNADRRNDCTACMCGLESVSLLLAVACAEASGAVLKIEEGALQEQREQWLRMVC